MRAFDALVFCGCFFGDLVNFNPRVRVLAADGAFLPRPAASVECVSEFAARAKVTWARLICKVYDIDPLDRQLLAGLCLSLLGPNASPVRFPPRSSKFSILNAR